MMMSIIDDRRKRISGHFYWIPTDRVFIASVRMPIESGTPEPRPYLMKVPLTEGEMGLSLLVLEKRYPYKGDEPCHEKPSSGRLRKVD